ncbi:hypothetical protein IV203_028061 [Nitzschia inconspicua]|uniref:Uncharacterized protein n=1 Tax=Nitzschia inconspicua TaxID=303405 RepID=A0A9K3Q4Q5_9STRA|nr:hypothetical protein IV203_028061 [Nitzschia inconspicua]
MSNTNVVTMPDGTTIEVHAEAKEVNYLTEFVQITSEERIQLDVIKQNNVCTEITKRQHRCYQLVDVIHSPDLDVSGSFHSNLESTERHFAKYDLLQVFMIVDPVRDAQGKITAVMKKGSDYKNLFQWYASITMDRVLASNMWYQSYPVKAWYKQNLGLTTEYLLNHMEPTLWERVKEDYNKTPVEGRGGPLLLYIMIKHIVIANESIAQVLVDKIKDVKLSNYPGEDVTKAVSYIRSLLQKLKNIRHRNEAGNEINLVPSDLTRHLYKIFQTSSNEHFNSIFNRRYIKEYSAFHFDEQTTWSDPDMVLDFAQNLYNNLYADGNWNGSITPNNNNNKATFPTISTTEDAIAFLAQSRCRNCDGPHSLRECLEPRNEERCKANKKVLQKIQKLANKQGQPPNNSNHESSSNQDIVWPPKPERRDRNRATINGKTYYYHFKKETWILDQETRRPNKAVMTGTPSNRIKNDNVAQNLHRTQSGDGHNDKALFPIFSYTEDAVEYLTQTTRCFNCAGPHPLPDCPEPIDEETVKINRKRLKKIRKLAKNTKSQDGFPPRPRRGEPCDTIINGMPYFYYFKEGKWMPNPRKVTGTFSIKPESPAPAGPVSDRFANRITQDQPNQESLSTMGSGQDLVLSHNPEFGDHNRMNTINDQPYFEKEKWLLNQESPPSNGIGTSTSSNLNNDIALSSLTKTLQTDHFVKQTTQDNSTSNGRVQCPPNPWHNESNLSTINDKTHSLHFKPQTWPPEEQEPPADDGSPELASSIQAQVLEHFANHATQDESKEESLSTSNSEKLLPDQERPPDKENGTLSNLNDVNNPGSLANALDTQHFTQLPTHDKSEEESLSTMSSNRRAKYPPNPWHVESDGATTNGNPHSFQFKSPTDDGTGTSSPEPESSIPAPAPGLIANFVTQDESTVKSSSTMSSTMSSDGGIVWPPRPELGKSNRKKINGKHYYYHFKKEKWLLDEEPPLDKVSVASSNLSNDTSAQETEHCTNLDNQDALLDSPQNVHVKSFGSGTQNEVDPNKATFPTISFTEDAIVFLKQCRCYNCDGPHPLPDCPEPVDDERVKANKKTMNKIRKLAKQDKSKEEKSNQDIVWPPKPERRDRNRMIINGKPYYYHFNREKWLPDHERPSDKVTSASSNRNNTANFLTSLDPQTDHVTIRDPIKATFPTICSMEDAVIFLKRCRCFNCYGLHPLRDCIEPRDEEMIKANMKAVDKIRKLAKYDERNNDFSPTITSDQDIVWPPRPELGKSNRKKINGKHYYYHFKKEKWLLDEEPPLDKVSVASSNLSNDTLAQETVHCTNLDNQDTLLDSPQNVHDKPSGSGTQNEVDPNKATFPTISFTEDAIVFLKQCRCYNCDGPHPLPDCPEPVDDEKVKANKKTMNKIRKLAKQDKSKEEKSNQDIVWPPKPKRRDRNRMIINGEPYYYHFNREKWLPDHEQPLDKVTKEETSNQDIVWPPKPERRDRNRMIINGKPYYYHFNREKWLPDHDRPLDKMTSTSSNLKNTVTVPPTSLTKAQELESTAKLATHSRNKSIDESSSSMTCNEDIVWPPKPARRDRNRTTINGKPYYYHFKRDKWLPDQERSSPDNNLMNTSVHIPTSSLANTHEKDYPLFSDKLATHSSQQQKEDIVVAVAWPPRPELGQRNRAIINGKSYFYHFKKERWLPADDDDEEEPTTVTPNDKEVSSGTSSTLTNTVPVVPTVSSATAATATVPPPPPSSPSLALALSTCPPPGFAALSTSVTTSHDPITLPTIFHHPQQQQQVEEDFSDILFSLLKETFQEEE